MTDEEIDAWDIREGQTRELPGIPPAARAVYGDDPAEQVWWMIFHVIHLPDLTEEVRVQEILRVGRLFRRLGHPIPPGSADPLAARLLVRQAERDLRVHRTRAEVRAGSEAHERGLSLEQIVPAALLKRGKQTRSWDLDISWLPAGERVA